MTTSPTSKLEDRLFSAVYHYLIVDGRIILKWIRQVECEDLDWMKMAMDTTHNIWSEHVIGNIYGTLIVN
jgi:hypothetical protein